MTPANRLIQMNARHRFAVEAARPEIDLARAALLIAEEDQPRFSVAAYLRKLDEFGAMARTRINTNASEKTSDEEVLSIEDSHDANEVVAQFNRFFFDELGFAGDAADYYHPRNSHLNQVIDRRAGLPISLSIVYIETARRAGLHAHGIGFPGHFLVKVAARNLSSSDVMTAGVLVDPFNLQTIDEEDCQSKLDEMYGGQVALLPEHLRPVTNAEILVRVLRNLKGSYTQTGMARYAIRCAERILIVDPHQLEEHRDRGLLLAQLKRFSEAIIELRFYIRRRPHAADIEQVREQLRSIQTEHAQMN